MCVSRDQSDGEEKELFALEKEHLKLFQRVAQVTQPDYLKQLKDKIAILSQKLLKPYSAPEDHEGSLDDSAEIHNLQAKCSELDSKIKSQSEKIQDLDNKISETEIKFKVLSEEAKEVAAITQVPTRGEESPSSPKSSPRKNKAGVLIKLVKTRYTVALGDYSKAKSELLQELAEAQEILRLKNQEAAISAQEVAELETKLQKGSRSGKSSAKLYQPKVNRQKVQLHKAQAQLRIKENKCAKIIQRAWRRYLKKKPQSTYNNI